MTAHISATLFVLLYILSVGSNSARSIKVAQKF